MRRLGGFLIFLVVMGVGALVVGELLIKPAVERRIGDEVQDRYGLVTRPAVEIDSFPFLVDAVRGELDGAQVEVADAVIEGLLVERADVDAERIRFDVFDLLRDRGQATAERVTARVQVAEPALDQYLLERGVPVDVSLGDGAVTVSGAIEVAGQALSGSATGSLAVEGSILRFAPVGVAVSGIELDADTQAFVASQLAFQVAVPPIVGVTVTGVEIGTGRGVLLAEAADYPLVG